MRDLEFVVPREKLPEIKQTLYLTLSLGSASFNVFIGIIDKLTKGKTFEGSLVSWYLQMKASGTLLLGFG